MIFSKRLRTNLIIHQLARKDGRAPADVRRDMHEAIDAAWATDDPQAKAYQEQLFPSGKPTVEEFLARMAQELQAHP